MDKLKPILAQKFWILSCLGAMLTVVGWWLQTSTMAKEISDRTTAIQNAFKNIPQPGPNKNWTSQVDLLNKAEEAKVIETGNFLWQQQLPLMTWPESIRPGVEFVGYRGEVNSDTRGQYRHAYEQELLDLYNIVSPFNPADGSGLVQFDFSNLHSENWGSSDIYPSSKQMWDSQEDIWMYRTLLTAVANLNSQADAKTILDSKIKEITFLELRGGTPGGPAKPSGGAPMGGPSGGASPPPAMAGGPGAPMGGMNQQGAPGGMQGRGGMGGPGGGTSLTASFDPAEQLGSDVDTAAGGGGSSAQPGGPPSAAMPPPSAAGGPGPKMVGGMTGSAPFGSGGVGGQARKRYIEEVARYKTRGFYMEVVMDHRVLPEFIGELSDSKWPIKVIRVQQVDRDLSDIGETVVGSGMPGGMPASSAGAQPGMGSMRPLGGMGTPSRPIVVGEGAEAMNSGRMFGGPPRMTSAAGGGGQLGTGESGIDLTVAMTKPYLVNVALCGIITLYLPPEQTAPASGTGTTVTAGTGGPVVTTPTVVNPADPGTAPVNPTTEATAPAVSPDPMATAAPGATPPVPATGGVPMGTGVPAAGTPMPASAATTTPAATTPAPAAPMPESTPAPAAKSP